MTVPAAMLTITGGAATTPAHGGITSVSDRLQTLRADTG